MRLRTYMHMHSYKYMFKRVCACSTPQITLATAGGLGKRKTAHLGNTRNFKFKFGKQVTNKTNNFECFH